MARSKSVAVKRSPYRGIDSPPFKKLLRLKAVEEKVQADDRDSCRNLRLSVSIQREYEAKFAELEEKLEQSRAETDFYFLKAEKLESQLQNLLLQQNPEEGFGDSDEASSACSSTSQSRANKWTFSRQKASLFAYVCAVLFMSLAIFRLNIEFS